MLCFRRGRDLEPLKEHFLCNCAKTDSWPVLSYSNQEFSGGRRRPWRWGRGFKGSWQLGRALGADAGFGLAIKFHFALGIWYLGFLAILVLVFGILVSQSSITLLWYSSFIHCFNQKRDNAMLEIAWIGPAAEKGLKTFEKKIRILTILYFNMVCVIKHKHCQWQNGPRHWVVQLFLSASTWLGLATFTKVERAVSEWVTYRQDDGRTWVQKVV